MRLGTGITTVTWIGFQAPFGTTEPSVPCLVARLTTKETFYSATWAEGGLKMQPSR